MSTPLVQLLGPSGFSRWVRLRAVKRGPVEAVAFIDPITGRAYELPVDALGTIGLAVEAEHPDKGKPAPALQHRLNTNARLRAAVLEEIEDLLRWEWKQRGVNWRPARKG